MEISDALPIQFWPFIKRITSGIQSLRVLFWDHFTYTNNNLIYGPNYAEWNTPTTFNELQNKPGMTDVCYYNPKDFADDIIVQFRAAPGGVYVLNMIRDDWHAFIFNQSIPEISSGLFQVTVAGSAQAKDAWGKYQFSICSPSNLATSNILPTISALNWTNQSDGGEDWNVSPGSASVTLTDVDDDSNRLMASFTDTDVDKVHVFNISGTCAIGGEDAQGYVLLKFYLNGVEVEPLRRRCIIVFNKNLNSQYSSTTNFSFKIVIPDLTLYQVDQVAISAHQTFVNAPTGSGFTVTLSTATASVYEPNALVYQKSDHYDCFWGEWDELEQGGYYGHVYGNQPLTPAARQTRSTVLIKYQNTDEFAGLDFSSSPGPEMYLRIPGRFIHESYPREEESMKLSSNEFLTLWSEQTRKVLLEVSHVPYYMHKKIQLALSCDFVNVGATEHISYPENDAAGQNAGVNIVARDAYQINEGDKRYPLKTASILLTDKETISRNLI